MPTHYTFLALFVCFRMFSSGKLVNPKLEEKEEEWKGYFIIANALNFPLLVHFQTLLTW